MPDPQNPETFRRSKLSRREDPQIAALYRRLFELRAELRGSAVEEVEFDEEERWLRLRRGPVEIVCNFAAGERSVPCAATEVVLATHGEHGVEAAGGTVVLPALGGAVLR